MDEATSLSPNGTTPGAYADAPGPSPAAKGAGRQRRWIISGVTLGLLLALYTAGSLYTTRSAFCNSCHEMTPYYAAWQDGPHADVACIKCHVDPGVVADFAHKFVALKEVWVHFTGDTTFPKLSVDLPNDRCLRCHDGVIDPGISDFDHEDHRNGRTCKTCHDEVGHNVTAGALEAAGILNAEVQAQRDARGGIVKGNGSGLPGHAVVGCSTCHDMPASTCGACHEPPDDHPQRPCLTCHTPDTWAFVHPDPAAVCTLCHDRPAGHRDGECSLCHSVAGDWAFVHPASGDCVACHTPPAGHYAGPCSACHTVGGVWAFAHPGSTACSNCHSAPGNHYGPTCVSCHSPSRAWASATINHPSFEEHTYRSFPCVQCHPNGYSSVNCTCHGGSPPEEEDD